MDNALPTTSEFETSFLTLLEQQPLPAQKILSVLRDAATRAPGTRVREWAAMLAQELVEAHDFHGLYLTLKDRDLLPESLLSPQAIRDLLTKSNRDRLISAFLETAALGDVPLAESFRRLDLLLALTPGFEVLEPTRGFGVIRRLDDFYKRLTVDFADKPGHVMTFNAACDHLLPAPPDHLLTLAHRDPAAMARLAAEKPADLARLALRSFGDLSVAKLEETLVRYRLIPAGEWKRFWEAARKELRADPLINLPARRVDLIQMRAQAETGQEWVMRLASLRDPRAILDAVAELESAGHFEALDPAQRATVADRIAWAVTGAHNTDPALYARLSIACGRLGLERPSSASLRGHLWEQDRYLKAAESLNVRDAAALIAFLLDDPDTQASTTLLAALERMPYALLHETLTALRESPDAFEACRRLLLRPAAPPQLVVWMLRHRGDLKEQPLPLSDLLHHAVAIIERTLSGEALRMQNTLKQFFAQATWVEAVFAELDARQRILLFERIQASPAWDPVAHRILISRMVKLDPDLAARKKATPDPAQEVARLTSWRSLAERDRAYRHLVEVELPRNSQDIAVARSYGDLRENFEYQAAKDQQRILLQRQATLQIELRQVRGTDFANVPLDQVGPGVTVTLRLADGELRTYAILGEWDRDESLSIISSQTLLAQNLADKRVGDRVAVPSPNGDLDAQIAEIAPLSDAIRAWMSSLPSAAL